MARCDEGYLCSVCQEEVKSIVQSDLYLRYVIGLVDPETLHLQQERHIRCNPALAQFIDDPEFQDLSAGSGFNKNELDPDFVKARSELVTRGFRRLKEVVKLDLPIVEYPLPEVRNRFIPE